MSPRRLHRATILSMVTGPATAGQAIERLEHPGVSASSCERNVTIRSPLGYLRLDGGNGPAPDLAPHGVDRLARRAGLAARGSRQPKAPAERLSVLLALLY